MKNLIVFYSRTGNTKKVAQELTKITGWEIEEIFDTKDRSGIFGYLFAGRDAMRKKLTELKQLTKNLTDYDFVVVGTPNWGGTVSAPVRTFLQNFKRELKKVAFFCTKGGKGGASLFPEMEEICGLKPSATLALRTKEVAAGDLDGKLKDFAAKAQN
jgi:flavodoxin